LYDYVILLPSMNNTFFNTYDVSKKEIAWWFVSSFYYSFETWLGRSTRDSADLGLEQDRVKKKAVKNLTDPTGWLNDPVELTRFSQKLGYIFYQNNIIFIYKKIKIDPGFELDRPPNQDSVKNSVTIHSLISFYQNNIIFIYKKIKINSGFEVATTKSSLKTLVSCDYHFLNRPGLA